MAVVGAESLAVVSEPRADVLVLGGGEDDVAISVISVGEGSVGARPRGRRSVRTGSMIHTGSGSALAPGGVVSMVRAQEQGANTHMSLQ